MEFTYESKAAEDAKEYLELCDEGHVVVDYYGDDIDKIATELEKSKGKSDDFAYAYCRFVVRQSNDVKPAQIAKILSSKSDDVRFKTMLGKFYLDGYGVEKDDDKAFQIFSEAASEGYAVADYMLGLCYENGNGVKKNVKQAVELYEKAAKLGLSEALKKLGESYAIGDIVKKNPKLSVAFYEQSSKQDDGEAEFALAKFYSCGFGVKKNLNTALTYYTLAANKGVTDAQIQLGTMYLTGNGVGAN